MNERDIPLDSGGSSDLQSLQAGTEAQLPLGVELLPARESVETASKGSSRGWLTPLKWAFSFPVMLGTFLVGRVFYEARGFNVDGDMWWHIKVGQDILRSHHFPTTDTYSFTVSGAPWIAYEWLGEVILGFVARLGGVLALDAFLIALASIIMLALYYLATLRSGNCKAGFIATLAICSIAFASFNMRPQMFGYLLLILVLIALEAFRKGISWPIWLLPPVFLIWVNTHGSFIIGIGVLVVYLLSGLRKFQLGSIEAVAWSRAQRLKLEGALSLCLAVLPVTPYGAQVAACPFDMAFGLPLNLTAIKEWHPIPFDIIGGKMFLAFVVIFIVLQAFFLLTWRLEEFVLVLGGTIMACRHVRFVMLFVPFFTPMFATMLARWVPPYKRAVDRYIFNAALMTAFIVAMVHFSPTREFLQKRANEAFPVAAVQYLEQHPVPGPMWDSYAFAGYLVASGRKVFIDGRGDIYERGGILSDYTLLSELKPGTLSILDRYGIQSCLVTPKEPLTAVLLVSPNWKRIYSDHTSVLFVRIPSLAQQAGGNHLP